jgi:hypothetical protein
MVEQDLKSLARRFNAQVDYASFEDMMRRRADGEGFNIGKALEANFYNPQSDAEMRIKAPIDRYHEHVGKQLETALFAQKKWLADAERSRATKEGFLRSQLPKQKLPQSPRSAAFVLESQISFARRHFETGNPEPSSQCQVTAVVFRVADMADFGGFQEVFRNC